MERSTKIPIESFFWIGYIMLIVNKFAALIKWTNQTFIAFDPFYMIGITFIMMFIIIRSLKNKDLFDFLLLGYGLISFVVTRDSTLLSIMCLILAIRYIDIDHVIRGYFIIQTIILMFCIITFISFMIIDNKLATPIDIDGNLRYSFWFIHPNNFSFQYMFTLLSFLYLKRRTITFKKEMILIGLSEIFIFLFPKTKTVVLVLGVYLFARFLILYKKTIWNFIIKYLLLFIGGIIILLTGYYYKNNFKVPEVTLGTSFFIRFWLAAIALYLYKINLFGYRLLTLGSLVNVQGNYYTFWLDLAYVRMIVNFGIVGACIFYYLLVASFKYYLYIKNENILILYLVIFLCGLTEWGAFSVLTAFPLLFLGEIIKNKHIYFSK